MSPLERVKECAEALVEKIEHLEADALRSCLECEEPIKADVAITCAPCVKLEEATCGECKAKLSGDDNYCDTCGAPPDCDGCGGQITQGHCSHCSSQEVAAAKHMARGTYPRLGIPPVGTAHDQVLAFLAVIPETHCRSEARSCACCQDARRLHELLTAQLGEVRA
jgi:hypothetical protein